MTGAWNDAGVACREHEGPENSPPSPTPGLLEGGSRGAPVVAWTGDAAGGVPASTGTGRMAEGLGVGAAAGALPAITGGCTTEDPWAA